MTTVAVLTIAHGRRDHLRHQHESLAAGSRRPDRYLVVAMDDPGLAPGVLDGLRREVVHIGNDPRGLPLAAARNLGAASAGEVDVLVLLDVDCLAGPDLVAAYTAAVAGDDGTVWSGPVTYLDPPGPDGYPIAQLDRLDAPHPARPAPGRGRHLVPSDPKLFWSLSFACSPTAWTRAGGFDEAYVGYGAEDTDFGLRVVGAGLRHGVLGDARAYHQWHPVSSPPVEHLGDILRNGALFHQRWGRWPMEGWLTAFADRGLVVRRGDGWEPPLGVGGERRDAGDRCS